MSTVQFLLSDGSIYSKEVIARVVPTAPHATVLKFIYLGKAEGNQEAVTCEERTRRSQQPK